MKQALFALLFVAVVSGGSQARASHITDVIDAFDDDNGDPYDLNVGVRTELAWRSGKIKRECMAGPCIANTDPVIPLANELKYEHNTYTLFIDPRMGLYKDLELYFILPIVLTDQTKLKFGTGVDYTNSTVVGGYQGAGTSPTDDTLFQVPFAGPERKGFGDMHTGIRYAPFNQERDWTRPNWVVGLEWTFPTGALKKATNKAVGRGVYELQMYTALSRRVISWAEPYFGLEGTIRFPSNSSLFKDHGKTQTLFRPGDSLGIQFGNEFVPWEVTEEDRRLTIDFGAAATYTFEGRDYTELFDALGMSPSDTLSRFQPGNTSLFHDPSDPNLVPRTDGITDVENYGVFEFWSGLAIQPIKFVELGAKFALTYEQGHFITFADAGKDLDKKNNVEKSNSGGLNEFNPVYNETYDKIGYRFKLEDSWGYILTLNLAGKF